MILVRHPNTLGRLVALRRSQFDPIQPAVIFRIQRPLGSGQRPFVKFSVEVNIR
jgi:hypothetical protein